MLKASLIVLGCAAAAALSTVLRRRVHGSALGEISTRRRVVWEAALWAAVGASLGVLIARS
jgi:hypothetical protein